MRNDCLGFRAALETELVGRPSQEKLAGLSWHEHLLACAECRDLLEKEEALELLLATLPEPRLPAPLLRRVLARLRKERADEVRLEGLLDALEGGVEVPKGLAADVLARLSGERRDPIDARLDSLLDLDREVAIPAGLAGRVLSRLASARRTLDRRGPRRISWLYAAAAGTALIVLGRFLWTRTGASHAEIATEVEEAPDPELLASLDVVEQWDLLMQDDVDVLLSTLGPADEALLDYR